MNAQLIVLENLKATDVFVENGLNPYLDQIAAEVHAFESDVTTDKGRKAIGSMARKVARSKTFLDGMGKTLNAEAKQKAKLVDNERKRCREILDDLRDEVRAPLTAFEDKQKQKEADQLAKYEVLKALCETCNWEGFALDLDGLSNSIIELNLIDVDEDYGDYELSALKAKAKGLLSLQSAINQMHSDREREQQEAKELADQEALRQVAVKEESERNAKMKAEAAAKAKIDRAEQDKQDAINREARARQDAIDAEERRLAQIEQSRLDAIAAEERRLEQIKQSEINAKAAADRAETNRLEAIERARLESIAAAERAEYNAQEAVRVEQQRQANEKAAKDEAQRLREADTEHRRNVNCAARDDFMKAGLSGDDAQKAVKALASNMIRRGSLNY